MSDFRRRAGRLGALALLVAVPSAGMAAIDPSRQEEAGPAKPSCTSTLVDDITPAGPATPARITVGASASEIRRDVWTRAIKASNDTKPRTSADSARKKSRQGVASRRTRRKPSPVKPKSEAQPFVELLGADPDYGG
jgi:hypothetical protein